MTEARDRVLALARERARRDRVAIGVTGPVGAGKSSLARLLGGTVIATDDYLPDYADIPEHERDQPHHADLDRLAADVESLLAGLTVGIPIWCFQEHRRIGFRKVDPAPLVICEGIHALHDRVRHVFDVTIYVEAPAADRWGRWEALERSGERGWGVEKAKAYFERVAEPTFAEHSATWRASADLVVVNADRT
jgi:uridine kinase